MNHHADTPQHTDQQQHTASLADMKLFNRSTAAANTSPPEPTLQALPDSAQIRERLAQGCRLLTCARSEDRCLNE